MPNQTTSAGKVSAYQDAYLRSQLMFLSRFVALSLLLLTASRSLLMGIYADRVAAVDGFSHLLIDGFRIDVATLFQIIALPCLLLLLLKLTPFSGRLLHILIRWWCWLFLVLLVFLEAATPAFITEYDTRPDRLFFEYLNAPGEVAGMLMSGYVIQVLVVTAITVLTGWLFRAWLRPETSLKSGFNLMSAVLMVPVLMVLVVGIRSGFQHRPINPAMVAFSTDRMVNTLPLNSGYSLMYAIYRLKNEASAAEQYGALPEQTMLSVIRQQLPESTTFISDDQPTLHLTQPTAEFQHKNLIIVVEESLGAQFVGSLGGKPLTPNIDRWKNKSWFFNRLYATGTRSARGLEAITTGFLPSPARAVLKLPNAQHDFYTLASTLKPLGYHSSFIYGGESHFDNMKGFFLGNGFDQVIDQHDYPNPSFTGNWGVSDEDLFSNALKFLKSPAEQPRLTVIFSSSNHTPFEFPDGKIELYDGEKNTVNNAVKYADFALGGFLDGLEEHGLLKNSVVLVVADHDARVMGESLVPLERFHIPGFIISDLVGNREDNRLVSQIDLAPTLLSLLGVEAATPMIGQDLTRLPDDYVGRAMMQYGDNQAFIQGDVCAVLLPGKQVRTFTVENGSIGQPVVDERLAETALAHAQFASWAYQHKSHSLPAELSHQAHTGSFHVR